jgi:hypothetical protein
MYRVLENSSATLLILCARALCDVWNIHPLYLGVRCDRYLKKRDPRSTERSDGQRFGLGGSPRPLPGIGGAALGTPPRSNTPECVEKECSQKSVCRILHTDSVTPTELAASSTLSSNDRSLYIAHPHKDALGYT